MLVYSLGSPHYFPAPVIARVCQKEWQTVPTAVGTQGAAAKRCTWNAEVLLTCNNFWPFKLMAGFKSLSRKVTQYHAQQASVSHRKQGERFLPYRFQITCDSIYEHTWTTISPVQWNFCECLPLKAPHTKWKKTHKRHSSRA